MKFNLQRVVDEEESWQWIFPQNVTWFSKCNSVRFGQNVQRSILAEFAFYQLRLPKLQRRSALFSTN